MFTVQGINQFVLILLVSVRLLTKHYAAFLPTKKEITNLAAHFGKTSDVDLSYLEKIYEAGLEHS